MLRYFQSWIDQLRWQRIGSRRDLRALGCTDWNVARDAAQALGRIRHPRAVEPLVADLLGHEHPKLRARP